MTRALRAATAATIAALVLVLILAELGRWHWFGDLFTSFRTQYLWLLAAAAVLALALRAPGWACVALLCSIVNGLHMVAWRNAAAPGLAVAGHPFRLVSFNLAAWSRDFSASIAFLDASDADAVLLLEVPPRLVAHFGASLAGKLPHRFVEAGSAANGALVFSRWPIVRQRTVPLGNRGALAANVILDVNGHSLEIYAAHLSWPMAGGNAVARNVELAELAGHAANCQPRCIVAGDFNVTQWSSHFLRLLRHSELRDCSAAGNAPGTWPAWSWPVFRIRIDHCLAGPGVSSVEARTGPATGSDHLAIIHDLRLVATASDR